MELRVYLENEVGAEFGFDAEHLAKTVAESVLGGESCPLDPAAVNLLITDGEGIRGFNREFRGIDRETDVLSFPNLEFPDGPGVFRIPAEQEADCLDPDTGEWVLGDMILCEERVRSQAEEYGHSIRREFAFLVCHSMLHLCGYDHEDEAEREEMERRQDEILSGLGIGRDAQ